MSQSLPPSCFNFSTLPTHYKLENPGNVLVFEHTLNQSYIHKVLTEYPRLRDFSNGPPYMSPVVYLGNIVATMTNASLVSSKNWHKDCMQGTSVSTIHFLRTAISLETSFSEILQNQPRRNGTAFSNSKQFHWIQLYVLRRELDNISPVKLFTATADLPVRLCLIALIIVASFLIKIKILSGNNAVGF